MVNKIFFSCCFLGFLFSCQVSKNVPKGFYLLQDNVVKLQKSGGTLTTADLEGVIRQQPNQQLIGMPFRLSLFNSVDSAKVAAKRQRKNDALLAENQRNLEKMNRINQTRIESARAKGRDYYTEKIIPMKDVEHPRRFFREWLKFKYGEKPVIFDSGFYCEKKDIMSRRYRRKLIRTIENVQRL
jgi:hypothetical protein